MTSAKRKKRNLYDVLGLVAGASLADIRRAHKEKVKARHPDVGGTAEEFMEVQHAYVVLRDEKRRAEYDRTGEDPGEEVDLRESQVLGVLAAVMDNLLRQPLDVLLPANCVVTMQNFMKEEMAAIVKAKHENEAKVHKLGKLVRRFRKRGEGHNVLRGMVEFQIESLRRASGQLDDAISLRREAIALLNDYEFDAELPTFVAGGWGQASSAWGSGRVFGSTDGESL